MRSNWSAKRASIKQARLVIRHLIRPCNYFVVERVGRAFPRHITAARRRAGTPAAAAAGVAVNVASRRAARRRGLPSAPDR